MRLGPVPALRPLGRLWGWAAKIRRQAYEAGTLKAVRAARPVVSVGNLTAGGNGKTPMCVHLANALSASGLRPAILSRGYGRGRSAPDPLVVSEGAGPLVPAAVSGDEPALMARLTGAVIVCARRRSDAAEEAVRLGADALILDDGFQHLSLARDLDILMLRSADPFEGGLVIPAGRLREPAAAHRRADVLVALGPDLPAPPGDRSAPPDDRSGPPSDDDPAVLAGPRPLFRAALVPTGLRPVGPVPGGGPGGRTATPPGALAGRRVAAFCGLADPRSFLRTLSSLGAETAGFLALPDHARYGPGELAKIRELAARLAPDLLVTTAKDAVKLDSLGPETAGPYDLDGRDGLGPSPFGPPLLALETELRLDRPDELLGLVLAAVEGGGLAGLLPAGRRALARPKPAGLAVSSDSPVSPAAPSAPPDPAGLAAPPASPVSSAPPDPDGRAVPSVSPAPPGETGR